MAPLPNTRVYVDESYVSLVGHAVYLFAYYEWAIISLIEHLETGFVARYSRHKTYTSGRVRDAFESIIQRTSGSFEQDLVADLNLALAEFDRLIVKRNALIHAHPVTASDDSHRLSYQTLPTKPLPDMEWSEADIASLIREFDVAAVQTISVLDRLR